MQFFRWLYHQPYLLLTLCTLIWAGNVTAGKLAVGHISPLLLTSARWGLVILLVMPFALPHIKREWPVLRPRLPYLFALGAIGFTTFNILMYWALNHTSLINAAIEQASIPFVVFLLNFLVFHLRVGWLQIVGCALTLVGVMVTATGGNPLTLTSQPINSGDLAMLCAVVAFGLYSVMLRYRPDIHWLSFIGVLGVSAFLASLPFSFMEIASGNALYPDFTGWMVVIFAAVFPSIISQTFWVRGLQLLGSNRGGVFINLVPVFATLFAISLLGERFFIYHAIALALVIGGVGLVQYRQKNSKQPTISS